MAYTVTAYMVVAYTVMAYIVTGGTAGPLKGDPIVGTEVASVAKGSQKLWEVGRPGASVDHRVGSEESGPKIWFVRERASSL